MNNTIRTSLYFLIVIVILGLILYPKFKPKETGAQVQQTSSLRATVLPVEAKVVSPTRIENIIKITGAILANESVALRSEISGKVEKIYFKEGQRVKRGDVMLTINDDEMAAQVERLKYTMQLNEEIEYRQRQLLEREAISKEEYDIALTTVKTTQSEIKELEARLAKHRIYAPFDGIVGLRQVSEGSYISPTDLVANMYSINPIKIEFSVPGKYTQKVKAYVVGCDRLHRLGRHRAEQFLTGHPTHPFACPARRPSPAAAMERSEGPVLVPIATSAHDVSSRRVRSFFR